MEVLFMLGDFTYSNPTKIYFGENSLDNLSTELKNYGKNVLLVYGGGSIKKNGIYFIFSSFHLSSLRICVVLYMYSPLIAQLYEELFSADTDLVH